MTEAHPFLAYDCVQANVEGHRFSTYRVGGPIAYFAQPKTEEAAVGVLVSCLQQQLPLTVLGGGSNSIISSQGIEGLAFSSKALTQASAFTLEPNNRYHVTLGAGWPLARVAKLMQAQSLTGLEFMIGIPGTLGGAVAMNAGAMGQDTAQVVHAVTLFNMETQAIETWQPPQLAFSYRKSAIQPASMIVLSVELSLNKGEQQVIDELMQKSLQFRQTHHPKEPNGGSVFKNPSVEKPAGLLLDQLGAKNWSQGGARVSALHANFIVNSGSATSTDILMLMTRMKQAVWDTYEEVLWPENRFLGKPSPEEAKLWKELTQHDPANCHAVRR